jgi:hypothetical protein
MAGKAFTFTVNGGAPFTVLGGNCSGPKSAPAGNNVVTETPASGTEVQTVSTSPSDRLVDRSGSSATVSVVAGSTPANETLVRFYNQPTGGTTGLLKVCKVAADASLEGRSFSFTENGGPAFSVSAGSAANPHCDSGNLYDVGTRVNIKELALAGTHVSAINVSDGRGTNVSTTDGTVTATVGSGTTVVTYTNALDLPGQKGFIEVCKLGADQFVNGAFTFSINASGFTATESVQTGQCTGPIEVPAGNVDVSEAARSPYVVSSIVSDPANRLVIANTANRTATVQVPVGDESTETRVDFTNSTQLGLVKVCKTLSANASALAGSTFVYDVSSAAGNSTLSVIAGAAGTTACRFLPSGLPLGSSATITERGGDTFQVTAVRVAPSSADAGSSGATARLNVISGTVTATFTNQALGRVEVCKVAADPSTASQSFQFSVNGGAPITVRPGNCSPAIVVPAGTATVSESVPSNFALSSVTANNGRLISGPTDNPATVSVVAGGVGTETVVTFTDRVKTGNFKVCKASPESSLLNTTFTFTYSYTVNGATTTSNASLKPGECSGLSANIPVVDANGQPITVHVSEAPTATVQVSSIVLEGAATLTASNTGTGTASFTQGNGTASLTFTNVRTPVG